MDSDGSSEVLEEDSAALAADREELGDQSPVVESDADGDDVASHYLDSFPDLEPDLLVRIVNEHASTIADIEKARDLAANYSRVPRASGMISLIKCSDPEEGGAHAGIDLSCVIVFVLCLVFVFALLFLPYFVLLFHRCYSLSSLFISRCLLREVGANTLGGATGQAGPHGKGRFQSCVCLLQSTTTHFV